MAIIGIDRGVSNSAVAMLRCGRFAVLASLTMACAPQYAYVPRGGVTERMGASIAAEYPIPPEAPRGDMQVASYGIVRVSSERDAAKYLHALHMRAIVTNHSDAEWTFDTREQRLDLDGWGQSAPAFASANPGTPPPDITISPSGQRVIDLFFPLPADLQEAARVPTFNAVWTLHAGARQFVERTEFERLKAEPEQYASYDYGRQYAWGPTYWVNPLYADFGFLGAMELEPEFIERPVIIRQEWDRQFEPRGDRTRLPVEPPRPAGPRR